jgi:hypothetical protein
MEVIVMANVEFQIALDSKVAGLLQKRTTELHKPAEVYLSELIIDDVRRHEEALAEEGYRLLSSDTEAFATEALPLANEVWTRWENK